MQKHSREIYLKEKKLRQYFQLPFLATLHRHYKTYSPLLLPFCYIENPKPKSLANTFPVRSFGEREHDLGPIRFSFESSSWLLNFEGFLLYFCWFFGADLEFGHCCGLDLGFEVRGDGC